MLRATGPDAQVDAFCYLPGHPLLALACEGQAALLAKVLQMGADPNAVDSRGLTGKLPERARPPGAKAGLGYCSAPGLSQREG